MKIERLWQGKAVTIVGTVELDTLEAHIEELDGLMRFIPTIAHIVRAGHHRLAKVIDEETTDEEKVALTGFEEEVAALRGEEER